MQCWKKVLVMAVFCFCASCSNPKGTSEDHFRDAIDAYLATTGKQTYLVLPEMPHRTRPFDTQANRMKGLAAIGFVSYHPGKAPDTGEYRLTAKGKSLFVDNAVTINGRAYGGFFTGTIEVFKILDASEPTLQNGLTTCDVTFICEYRDAPAWTLDPKLLEHVITLRRSPGNRWQSSQRLVLTDSGWKVCPGWNCARAAST